MPDALTDAELDRMEASTSFHCHAEVQRLVAEVRRLRGVIATKTMIDRSSVGSPVFAAEQMRQAIIAELGEQYRERLEAIDPVLDVRRRS